MRCRRVLCESVRSFEAPPAHSILSQSQGPHRSLFRFSYGYVAGAIGETEMGVAVLECSRRAELICFYIKRRFPVPRPMLPGSRRPDSRKHDTLWERHMDHRLGIKRSVRSMDDRLHYFLSGRASAPAGA